MALLFEQKIDCFLVNADSQLLVEILAASQVSKTSLLDLADIRLFMRFYFELNFFWVNQTNSLDDPMNMLAKHAFGPERVHFDLTNHNVLPYSKFALELSRTIDQNLLHLLALAWLTQLDGCCLYAGVAQ